MHKEFYFLGRDNDGHWYIIPRSNKEEWKKWVDLPSDDEASWEVPDFVIALGGSPSLVHFGEFYVE